MSEYLSESLTYECVRASLRCEWVILHIWVSERHVTHVNEWVIVLIFHIWVRGCLSSLWIRVTHMNEKAPENVFRVRTSDRMKEQREDDCHADLCRHAVFCSVLQCVAVCYGVMLCGVVWCGTLQYDAVWCSVLQRVAVCYSVMQCSAMWCSVLQSGAVCCNVLPCVAVFCRVSVWVRLFAGNESCHTYEWESTREFVSETYQRKNEGAETRLLPPGLVSTRSVLQWVAVCYSVLQCVAVCCSVL